MSDQVQRQARGRYAPGTTGNAAGRPRSGLALAEAIRRRVDPERILDLVDRLLADETVPVADRLAAVLPWMGAGYLKPPTTAAVAIETQGAPQLDWSRVPLATRLALLEAIKSARALDAGAPPAGDQP